MQKKNKKKIKQRQLRKKAIYESKRKEKRRLERLSTRIENITDKQETEDRRKKREEADELSRTP